MSRRTNILLCIILVFGVGAARVLSHHTRTSNPNALWQIVHEKCVPDAQQHGNPQPCALVDLASGEAQGYAVLKDIHGLAQFLLIPTALVSGIESPALLASGAPNYWQAAWAARRFMSPYLSKPIRDEDVALAVNSREGRSQNQLHIHIDCVRPDVKQALATHQTAITRDWSRFPITLAGHPYQVMRVDSADLSGYDLFSLLARTDTKARQDMGVETLAAVGAVFADGSKGFYVLNDHVAREQHDFASSEQLLDHDCTVVNQ